METRINGDAEALLAKGAAWQDKCRLPLSETATTVAEKVEQMRTNGCTALGPALAVAVGLTAGFPGSKIMLCTDGEANQGVGTMTDRSKDHMAFYQDMAARARRNGVTVSVVTVEGENCGMESLGLLADVTSGQVDIVTAMNLTETVDALLKSKTVATNAKCRITAPPGFTVTYGGLASGSDSAGAEEQECALNVDLGNISIDTDLTFGLATTASCHPRLQHGIEAVRVLSPAVAGAVTTATLVIELQYTQGDGEAVTKTLERTFALVADRAEAESDINSEVVSLAAIHKSAALAQAGRYMDARVHLVSTQRLLQRAMHNRGHQEDYMRFIVQAEKLDQFMVGFFQ